MCHIWANSTHTHAQINNILWQMKHGTVVTTTNNNNNSNSTLFYCYVRIIYFILSTFSGPIGDDVVSIIVKHILYYTIDKVSEIA